MALPKEQRGPRFSRGLELKAVGKRVVYHFSLAMNLVFCRGVFSRAQCALPQEVKRTIQCPHAALLQRSCCLHPEDTVYDVYVSV